jgi:anti-sigma factor RsiW
MNRPAPPPSSNPPPGDDELHAWIDGQLASEARRAAVEDLLARDPAVARQVAQWQAQRDALRRLHGNLLEEPIPVPLMHALDRGSRRVQDRQDDARSWMRWGGMAAGVLIAFAAGWLGNAQWSSSSARHAGDLAARTPAVREFVHAASVAHAVYAPEKRHPVEVAASEQQHLVQWLSRRLDRPLKVPDLSAQGYTLVGGRLLPGDAGARAQFMFEDPAGERITLYIGTLAGPAGSTGATGSNGSNGSVPSANKGDAARETAFRFATDGPVQSFYWVDQGFGYAIAGKLPREALLKLATLAYQELT